MSTPVHLSGPLGYRKAEFWYNASSHSAIGHSPFEALYGYPPRHFGITAVDSVSVPELSAWLQGRQVMTDLIHQHLSRAKEHLKHQADKNISERQFQVGDSVFLKLQPYVQSTLAPRANQKLAFKYYGPFKVIACIGSVAYKLELPTSSTVHPVFHVSQLKRAILPGITVSFVFPTDIELPHVPIYILQRRMVPDGPNQVEQVLVQWSDWPTDMVTLETMQALRQAFPRAPAWGQAVPQAPGNVNSGGFRNGLGGGLNYCRLQILLTYTF